MTELSVKDIELTKKEVTIIILSSIAIAIVSSINGMTAEWARAVSTSLLTVAGLVFGFVILGITNLANKDFIKALHEYHLRKNIDKLCQKLQGKLVTKEEAKPLMQKEFLEAIGNTYKSEGYIIGSFLLPVILLLISIGFSFCLYGVNTTLDISTAQGTIFIVIYNLSIMSLFLAVYGLFKTFVYAIGASTLSYSRFDSEIVLQILDEKIREEEKEEKNSQKTPPG